MPCHVMPCPAMLLTHRQRQRVQIKLRLQSPAYLALDKPPPPSPGGGGTNRCARQETAHVEHLHPGEQRRSGAYAVCQTSDTIMRNCQRRLPATLPCRPFTFALFSNPLLLLRPFALVAPAACVGVIPNTGTCPAAAVLVCLLLLATTDYQALLTTTGVRP